MPAGYSTTPLLKKPGIQPEMKVLLINPPDDYYSLLDTNIADQLCKKNDTPNFVHLFVYTAKELAAEIKKLRAVCKKNTAITIWVSWYKKAAKIPTDVTEDVIRNYARKKDLVDVKVCAVMSVVEWIEISCSAT